MDFCSFPWLHSSSEVMSVDPDKLTIVKLFPTHKTVKEVRSLLRLCNYYLQFLEGFAQLASPLNKLTRKNRCFPWTADCNVAFEELNTKLCSPPILTYSISLNPSIFILLPVILLLDSFWFKLLMEKKQFCIQWS